MLQEPTILWFKLRPLPPPSDSNSSPKLQTKFEFDGKTGGCGDFFVFRGSKDETKAISISVEKKDLKLSAKPQTFEIEGNKSIKVYIEDFGKAMFTNREGYCVDSTFAGDPPVHIPAIKGKVTVFISKNLNQIPYYVTVILENVSFQTSDQTTFIIEKVKIKDESVGLYPG